MSESTFLVNCVRTIVTLAKCTTFVTRRDVVATSAGNILTRVCHCVLS